MILDQLTQVGRPPDRAVSRSYRTTAPCASNQRLSIFIEKAVYSKAISALKPRVRVREPRWQAIITANVALIQNSKIGLGHRGQIKVEPLQRENNCRQPYYSPFCSKKVAIWVALSISSTLKKFYIIYSITRTLVIRLHVWALSIPLKHLCVPEPTGK